MDLKNSVAVLSGAGRIKGVGAATAKLLAQEGCRILINCIKSDEQAKTVINDCNALGVEADLFLGDLTSLDVCLKMEEYVRNRWGRADILVNCLGLTKSASYENLDALTTEDFYRIFSVNAFAPYFITQAFKSLLKKSPHAVIINVSSAAGITGKGSSIVYAAAKGAENTLTLALAQALAPEIRVNAVCPNFIDSSWWEENFKNKEEKYEHFLSGMKESNLLGKVLIPQDVAYTILSIIKNPIMTGELVRIDSGAHLGNLKKQ